MISIGSSIRLKDASNRQRTWIVAAPVLAFLLPILLGVSVLHAWTWDLSIPFIYPIVGGDETWQLVLTKVLKDTGWVLTNPYLGAPEVANWHHNAAAQTSPIHSVVMLAMSAFIDDAVRLQQVYFLLNFGLIGLASFWSCRLLGIARLAAIAVGLMFSVITYRWHYELYAFIPNYWAVPLGMAAIYWCITGTFIPRLDGPGGWTGAVGRLARTPRFWGGLISVLLVTASDGYYAFFMLLLLAFSGGCRLLAGDWRQPRRLMVVVLYGLVLLLLSLGLTWPLSHFKATHHDEFFPGGVEDSVLVKQPFEAEVYAVSFKMLLTPWPNHRVRKLADLGRYMQDSTDQARKYPTGLATFTLGALGSVLMLMFLGRLIRSAMVSRRTQDARVVPVPVQAPGELEAIVAATAALTLFIMLGSISGGIGALIALVFPTIRAYERFPLFMLFALYCGAAAWWTLSVRRMRQVGRCLMVCALVAVTMLSLFDEIPPGMNHRSTDLASRFLAERSFVQKLEADVAPGSMVYRYPHSQYLTDSKYYGWGSFAHVRLYLHSKKLRWDGGAAKNSPVDDWHTRIAALPGDEMLTELQAVGFAAFVVDRRVIDDTEYETFKNLMHTHGVGAPVEDAVSKLAYFKLADPGYRLAYQKDYRHIQHLDITNRDALHGQATISGLINRPALEKLLSTDSRTPLRMESSAHPEIFHDSSVLDRGLGTSKIEPLTDMQGGLTCTSTPAGVTLRLVNNSGFVWRMGEGAFPLRIGVHLKGGDGTMKLWDDETRVPASGYLRTGQAQTYHFAWSQLKPTTEPMLVAGSLAEFEVLQDGHAWFAPLACTVPMPVTAP